MPGDAGSCWWTGRITNLPVSNLAVSGSPAAVCSGNFSLLTASGAATYAWTASPPYAFADSTNPVQTVTPLVTTIFIV